MAGLIDLQDALDPGHDLVRGGVGGLIEVDHTVALELKQGSGSGRPAAGQRGEVVGLNVELIKVLNNKGD